MTLLSLLWVLLFARPLGQWLELAMANPVYSHLPLVPLVAAYLIWLRCGELPLHFSTPIPRNTALLLIATITSSWAIFRFGITVEPTAFLAVTLFFFLLLLLITAWYCLGTQALKRLAFPVAFSFFILPLPHSIENLIEVFFQHASAEMSYLLIQASQVTVLREGLTFYLPGIALEVAPECSGVRSTMVLFLSSLVAGNLFLRSNWFRVILALVVVPLGIFRNGIRIATLANLCVYGNPELIHSPLHSKGGPLFFLLSLIPFFLLLIVLRKLERKGTSQVSK